MKKDKPMINWQKVESSAIDAIAYDPIEEVLMIEFKKGIKWKYHPVTSKDYQLLKAAPSMGSFFHQHIKTNPGITAEKL